MAETIPVGHLAAHKGVDLVGVVEIDAVSGAGIGEQLRQLLGHLGLALGRQAELG